MTARFEARSRNAERGMRSARSHIDFMATDTILDLDSIAGPKGVPVFGSVFDLRRDNLGFLSRCAEHYGDIVRFTIGPLPVLLVTHPRDVKYILQENSRNYTKAGYGYDQLRAVLGRGLIFNEGGEFWRRQRKLTLPAFHIESLKRFIEQFNLSSELMVERWRRRETSGERVDIMPEMMKVTLDIVGQTLLSKDLLDDADGIGRALSVTFKEVDRRTRLLTPITNYLPTPKNFRVRKARAALDALVYSMIEERRHLAVDHHRDLLAMYMSAIDESTGTGMTDLQVHDEVMNIFPAGHETTAVALSWLWQVLSLHPQVERKLRIEVDEVLAGRPVAFEDLPKLKYVEAVFLETLRLYPPVWLFMRRASAADQIHNCRIPAGTTIFVCPYITQRDPRYWPEPTAFRPERFLGEEGHASRFEFFPFAGGPRVCIGQRFATMEAVTIIARVLQNFELTRTTPASAERVPAITLRPKNPILFRLRSRKSVW